MGPVKTIRAYVRRAVETGLIPVPPGSQFLCLLSDKTLPRNTAAKKGMAFTFLAPAEKVEEKVYLRYWIYSSLNHFTLREGAEFVGVVGKEVPPDGREILYVFLNKTPEEEGEE